VFKTIRHKKPYYEVTTKKVTFYLFRPRRNVQAPRADQRGQVYSYERPDDRHRRVEVGGVDAVRLQSSEIVGRRHLSTAEETSRYLNLLFLVQQFSSSDSLTIVLFFKVLSDLLIFHFRRNKRLIRKMSRYFDKTYFYISL
jgi:hypothetical protein